MPERTRLIEIIFLMGIVLIVNGATEILVNPRGSYTWAVGTPNITLIFNSSINDRLYFPRFFEVCRLSWRDKKSGGRIFEEIVPLYEHRYRPSKIWNYLNWSSVNPNETGWYIIRWSEYQQYNRTTGFILTFDGASAYNQTSIIFRSRYDRMVLLMDITIKGCHAHTMPADLLITDAPLSYNIGEEVVVKCRRNILFLQNSTYSVQNTTIVCSNASTWNVPNYGCQSGCPNLPFLRSNPALEIYMRIGEKQYFECPHGYMLYNKYQKRFQAKVARVCTGNMTWTADRFSCQAVHPASDVHSFDVPVGWQYCRSTPYDYYVRIYVARGIRLEIADRRWLQYIGRVKPSPKDLIQIRRNQSRIYTLTTSNSAIISFDSNLPVNLNNIRITKNETEIHNYYLLSNETFHRVITHFYKVHEEDYGVYEMTISRNFTSDPLLVFNYTLIKSTEKKRKICSVNNVTLLVGIGSALIVILSSMFFGYVIWRRRSTKLREHEKSNNYSTHVDGHHKAKSPNESNAVQYVNTVNETAHSSQVHGDTTYEQPLPITQRLNAPGAAAGSFQTVYEYDN